MKKLIKVWLVLMVAGVFTAGCVYVIGQQIVRQSANGPAAAIAYQTAMDLDAGMTPDEATAQKTNIFFTLDPFVMIYDNNKNLVATSAGSGNDAKVYHVPASVLDSVDENHDNRVTWQPQTGLRYATVAIKYDGGYVVGAVSLKEPERLIGNITTTLFIGSAAYAVGCALVLLIVYFVKVRGRP